MAQYPFVYNYQTGRTYYGPSLDDKKPTPQLWLRGAQTPFYNKDNPPSKVAWAAAGLGAAAAAGFLPKPAGGRVWDWYVKGIRAVEEYSPAQILRTFQLSNFFSQFETATRTLKISPELLRANRPYAEYLSQLIGGKEDVHGRLIREGVELKNGRLVWGETGQTALRWAAGIRVPQGAHAYYPSAYARSLGATEIFERAGLKPHRFLADEFPVFGRSQIKMPTAGGMPTTIIGGRHLPQHLWRQATGWGTEWVSRFNRLLEAPFEMQPFRTVFGKAQAGLKKVTGRELAFAVKEGPDLRMLGKLSLKYGAAAAAIGLGYQTLDWMARRSELLDETAFAEGITAGIGTLGVQAQLAAAEIAEKTGLQRYRELQEEVAPGSTSIQKLLAYPILGGGAALLAGYGVKTYRMAALQMAKGIPAHEARKAVMEGMKEFSGDSLIARIGRSLTTSKGLYARQDTVGKIWRKFATKQGDKLSFAFLGKVGPAKLTGLLGVAAGAALTLPFWPGAVIPEESPEELRRIYSGEEEIPIRRGRWWEFGRSPYEGQRIMYYRPHWYPRMMMRAREKGIWGPEEDELSPLQKLFKREFTYELEEKHYKERPYPITGLPFEDVPFIGPLLANTLGRFIKPPRLMHTEEWVGPEGVKAEPPRFGGRVATEVGEVPGGIPESPYGAKGLAGEQIYRLQEMFGLAGFAQMSIKERLTGSADWFDQIKQLESARRIAGFERFYWDLELGGLAGTTEAFRRLYPHRRRQIPLYNPIRNMMPEWLPGPGEKSPDFRHGDPFVKVPEGELRLPGRGYEARFPELEGLKPEDYPLIHKYKILADVAPYSDKYKIHRNMVRAARKRDEWTDQEEAIFQVTEEQVAAKKTRIEFQEYKYLSPMGKLIDKSKHWGGEESSSLIAALNKAETEEEKEGIAKRLFGGYWELLAHNAETAFDQLTPVSPGAKLVHVRTPLEAYERLQVYGTESAFWQHPVKHFIKPFSTLLAKSFGYENIPEHIRERRNLEQYFDTLEYVKYARLANLARKSSDVEAVKEFERKKDETLFGINPFTRNYRSIFRALPRRERDYFNAFSAAESTEERARILELVPENEKALYIARWKLAFADEVKKARKAEFLTEEQLEEADTMVDQIYDEARAEGFPHTKELFAEYIETRLKGETYGDWYRRTKLLTGVPMPGPDWVGWHPSVDLEDVKLRVVQTLGEDMHDYDLWASRAQTLINKPYISDEAVAEVMQPEELTEVEMHDRINELMLAQGIRPHITTSTTYGGTPSSLNVEIEQEDDEDMVQAIRENRV